MRFFILSKISCALWFGLRKVLHSSLLCWDSKEERLSKDLFSAVLLWTGNFQMLCGLCLSGYLRELSFSAMSESLI
jgi:hypothetical protein